MLFAVTHVRFVAVFCCVEGSVFFVESVFFFCGVLSVVCRMDVDVE